MSHNFLDHEIILLLAKYGEKEVVSVLAKNLDLSSAELESKLRSMRHLRPKGPIPSRANPPKMVESLLGQHPEKADYLKGLLSRFQNKTFLPELKDVRRFFHQHSNDVKHVKSRNGAALSLFKLLSNLELEELEALCKESERKEYSSLEVLSEEIMRRDR